VLIDHPILHNVRGGRKSVVGWILRTYGVHDDPFSLEAFRLRR
jgi:hypothetical protein